MSTVAAQTGSVTWNIDPAHSSIDFSVKHMGIFTVRGSLGTLSGSTVTVDNAIESLTVSADVTTLSTNNEQRDAHLKSPDFLDTAKYPTIDFKSTSVTKQSDTEFSVTGDLTINGNTHPLTVELEAVAPVTDPWGNTRSGATGTAKLSRKDWGLSYNSVMETGHVMISDEVKFTFDIQAVAKA